MEHKDFIYVWRFEDAPETLQNLSDNGGDEDWIAAAPTEEFKNAYIGWIVGAGFDTCCEPQIYENPDAMPGYTIYIGSHA